MKINGSITSESFKWNMDRSHQLCFNVLEEWAGNVAVSFRMLLMNVLLTEEKNLKVRSVHDKSYTELCFNSKYAAVFAGNKNNLKRWYICKFDLCAIIAESNMEWITYKFIPCYFTIINMYAYIFICSFLDIFCNYTQ